MHEYAMKAKILEINPHSPLITGLLNQVSSLSTDEDQQDLEAEAELREVASILIDGALIRSGYGVHDNNRYFFLNKSCCFVSFFADSLRE